MAAFNLGSQQRNSDWLPSGAVKLFDLQGRRADFLSTGERYAIALDLGTTRSALSSFIEKGDYKPDHRKIRPDTWLRSQQADCKTETLLLFSSPAALGTTAAPVTIESAVTNASFREQPEWVNIGPESRKAIERWASAKDQVGRTAYYVRDFKMMLDVQSAREKSPTEVRLNDLEVTAFPIYKGGSPIMVNLRLVFTAYISCAAKIGFEDLVAFASSVRDPQLTVPTKEQVNWVTTVPAIWVDQARIFMREAVNAAGLTQDQFSDKVLVCLEPEGAMLEAIRDKEIFQNCSVLKDQTVLVVDWGGGTCDITCSLVSTINYSSIELEERVTPFGGPYGGRNVNANLDEQLFRPWFGEEIFQKDWIQGGHRERFFRDHFEPAKCGFEKGIDLSFNLFNFFRRTASAETLKERIPSYNAAHPLHKLSTFEIDDEVQVEIPFSLIAHCINLCIDPVLRDVIPLVAEGRVPDRCTPSPPAFTTPPAYVFVVGGMGQNRYLKEYVRDRLPHEKLIFPREASMAIVQGAVRFGLDSGSFGMRKARTNYGVGLYNKADPSTHLWGSLIQKGKLLREVSKIKLPTYSPINEAQTKVSFPIYECAESIADQAVLTRQCYWVTEVVVQVNMSVPFEDRKYSIRLSMDGPVLSGKITDLSNQKETMIKWGSR